MDFAGKKVLITGGTRGIGKATAEAFLGHGASVAVNGRTASSVEAAVAAIGNASRLVAAPGDVGTVSGCRQAVNQAVAALGGLDVLINCAGVARSGSVQDVDEETWDETLDVNLKGAFFCSQAAIPALRTSLGNIVNVASDAGLMGCPGLVVYCASKGGLVNMTRAMALELAPEVRVNCVCPGYVDTDMVRRDHIDVSDDPAGTEQALIDYAPMKRIADPGEVARAILYLASDDARFVTGTALAIDGGTTAGR